MAQPAGDLQELLRRLTLTVDWFYDTGGAGQRFRAVYAVPSAQLTDVKAVSRRIALVTEVIERRVLRLAQSAASSPPSRRSLADFVRQRYHDPVLAGGRLVAFNPDETLSDGAAERAAAGYFDVENEPGWDVWVNYVAEAQPAAQTPPSWPTYLIAWVPQEWVKAVDEGINVNPEACIEWLDALTTPFVAVLKEAGVLRRNRFTAQP